jgi:uncharacterized protein (DUF58 family)
MNASMHFATRNTFKSVQAARIAALLGWRGIGEHERISACLFGAVDKGVQYYPPKRTQRSFAQVLKTLTLPLSESKPVPLKAAFEQLVQSVHTGSLLYVISDFMEIGEEWLPQLRKKCEIVFISVNDPADKSLCPLGPLFFSHGHDKVQVNTDSLAGRKAYAASWEANRLELKLVTTRYKIPLIELSTESDVLRELPGALNLMAKRKS